MKSKRTYIIVEVTKTLKGKLQSIARRERRDLSDIVRFELERLARNGSNAATVSAPQQ